tara:strand:- start:14976 stop:18689 length:3714 start_codon:yes stop_codon:yes gene_type:complete
MANERNMIWNYPLLTTSENKQGKRTFTPKEFSYETVGVDFSVKGGLRPFPGFTEAHVFSSLPSAARHGVGSEVIDVFPVSFRIGTEYFGYGIVYRAKQDAGNSGTVTNGDVFIDYYIKGEGWTRGTLLRTGSGDAHQPMDVVVFGRYVYVFIKSVEPVLFYVKYAVAVAATASVTIADQSLLTATDTLKIISTSEDVHTITAILTGVQTNLAGSNTTGTFRVGTGTSDTATNLATCINGSGRFTASAVGSQVTITQYVSGETGNTVVTLTLVNAAAASKSNFSGGTGFVGVTYKEVVETDTGPGVQMGIISPGDVNAVTVGTLGVPSSVSHAQVFTASTVGTHWDTTPEDMDDVANLEAGNYAVAYVLTDPDTGRKTSLSKLSQVKQSNLVTKAEGTVTFNDDTENNYTTEYVTISDGTNAVKFSMDETTSGIATSTITITAYTELNNGDKVNIVATDGTNYDFVCGAQNSSLGTWESDGSHATTATNLMNVINSALGIGGGRFTATVDGAVVTVAQTVIGTAGNTTVTLTDSGTAGMTKTDFTGGFNIKADSTNYTVRIDGAANAVAIAALFHTAVNLANTNGDLNITSSNSSSATCNLIHTKGTTEGNVDIVVYTTDTDITVTGMAGASNFDPGNIGIEIIYDSSKFSKARIYRSVRTQDAGGSYAASIVQLDKIITLADYLATDQTGMTGDYNRAIYYFRLSDLALIYQDPYIDRSVFDENMPKAGAGIEFDGILLTSNIEGSGTAGAAGEEGPFDQYRGLGEFRWSSMAEASPELFPPENYHIPSKIANQVSTFTRSGGVVLGFSNNVIMHISREFTGVSSYMKVLPIHEGFGLVNKKAIQSIGPFTYYVNEKGVKTVDAQARLDSLHALDGIIEDWKSDFSSLSMSYDSQGSVLFIMNKAKKEAALMWLNTASVSELYDMPFDLTVTGQWVSNLTDADSDLTERAFFLQNQPDFTSTNSAFVPKLWVMDTKRENIIVGSAASNFNGEQRITLLHGGADTRFRVLSFNSGAKTITIDTSTSGHQGAAPTLRSTGANWVGAYAYIIGVADVANESRIGGKVQIKSISGAVITYINESSGIIFSAGDRIGISPVYVKWGGSLLGYNDPMDPQNPTPTGLHIARGIDSISGYFSGISGASFIDNVNTKDVFYKGSMFEGDSITEVSSSVPVDLSGSHTRSIQEGESTYWAGFETHGVRGIAISPGLEVFCPDLDFRLLSVIIEGKILPTFRTERPT